MTALGQRVPGVDDNLQGARARILLVDDNLVNQEETRELLEQLHYEVVAVADGEAAVRAATEGRFVAILMDCQMPKMNGYEATAAIRAHEEGSGRRTPIIALTAHAFEEDREMALASGMDAHLAKPIDLQRLRVALARWLRPDSTGHANKATRLPRRVVEVSLEQIPKQLAALRSALIDGRIEEVGDLAHKLKGSYLVLGADAAVQHCNVIEQYAAAKDVEAGRAEIAVLLRDWNDIRITLEAELERG